MPIYNYLFSAALAFLALTDAASASTEACLPTNERKNGMNINFYEYALGDESTYTDPTYMASGYANTKKLGSVSGQTDLSIYYNTPCDTYNSCNDPTPVTEMALMKRYDENCPTETEPVYASIKRDTDDCDRDAAYWSSDLFGFYTTPTNVTIEMTGYFLPPEDGSYTFTFPMVDDSAILSIGGDTAFGCCAQEELPATSTDFTVDGVGKQFGYVEGSKYMYAGYYYPMKIVFSNANSSATLPIGMTLPNGSTIYDNYEGYVYSFDNNLAQANCDVTNPENNTITGILTTTTEPWTGVYTTTDTKTSTITGLNSLPTVETIIEVKTPTGVSSSSVPSTEVTTGSTTSSTPVTTISSTTSSNVTSSVATSSAVSSSVVSSFVVSSSASTSSDETSSASSSTVTSSDVTSSAVSSSVVTSSATSTPATIISSINSSNVTSSVATSSAVSSSVATSSDVTSSASSSTITSSDVTSSAVSSSVVTSSATSTPVTTISSTTSSNVTSSVASSSAVSSSVVSSSAVSSSVVSSSAVSSSVVSFSAVSSSVVSSSAVSSSVVSSSAVSSSVVSSSDVTSSGSSRFSKSSKTSTAPSTYSTATPIYPMNQTVVTSSASSTLATSGSSILLESSRSSTIGPIFRTVSESSAGSAVSTATSADPAVSSSTSSADPTTSSSTSSANPTVSSSGPSADPTISSFTTGSEDHESTVSSTSARTSSASNSSDNQSKIISTSTIYSNNFETTTVSASISSKSPSSHSLLSISSTPAITDTKSSGMKTETTSSAIGSTPSSMKTEVITSSSASSFKGQETTSEDATSASYRDRTTIEKVTSAVTTGEKTSLITVTFCESGVCSETATSAIFSTATTTVSGVATEYTTWCPVSTNKPTKQTTLVTVTSCESGVCSETASPAIVSTATTVVNDAVTAYTTWCPLTTNRVTVSASTTTGVTDNSVNPEAAETKTVTHSNDVPSISESGHAEAHPTTMADAIGHSSSVPSVSGTANTKGFASSNLNTAYEHPRSTSISDVVGSNTASLEISSYAGSANGLVANSALSVFIASILLAFF
ncbi:hypothetical protein SEUBUCD646_0L00180 [Saccharomyces eubayanus]|uniref:PA14 domain-containing protein n=1 Tax=Saccharomyces eubayanus TaxID=1080349 RepID=A0ABN8VDL4_SACEU|nr:hypothetical protein SEUBUCD650_0L00180 [Saccharomyces eubayanus]CAI1584972.1 hypothetical protein SEUBUCD646_0L00180 [Saccharomyces eubayanus]